MQRSINGFFLTLIWAVVAYLPAAATVQARSPNFNLSGDVGSETAIELIRELEEFRAVLLHSYGRDMSMRDQLLNIYIISDPDVFDILELSDGFVAVYAPSIAGPRVFVNGNLLEDHPDELRHSLRHEYVHHFNTRYQDHVVPSWLNEGFAEYYAGFEKTAPGQYVFGMPDLSRPMLAQYPTEGWFPMQGILYSLGEIEDRAHGRPAHPSNWRGPRPEAMDLFYAQCWAMVHYMKNQPDGMARIYDLNKYLIDLEAGIVEIPQSSNYEEYLAERDRSEAEIEGNIIAKLGHTEAELWTIIQTYMNADNLPVQTIQINAPMPAAAIEIETLSELQAEAIQYHLMSTVAPRATINAKMKEMRNRLDLDPTLKTGVEVSVAAQNIMLGNTVLALNSLDQILADQPDHPEANALRLYARYQEFNNEFYQNGARLRDLVRPLLAKNPNDPELLIMMAMSGIREIDEPPAEVTQALQIIEDTDLIDRRPVLALSLANLYLEKEDYATALYIAQRGNAFLDSLDFSLSSFISQLEDLVENPPD